MASFVIFRRPSDSKATPEQRRCQNERGDVIDMRDNDHFYWGSGVEAVGWWQVVVVPGAIVAPLWYLTAGSAGHVNLDDRQWHHRLWTVDLDALGEGQLPDGTWVVPLAKFLACCKLKPQINLLGI